jgi:hypothetical protein
MKTKLLAVIAVFVVFAATARAGGKHNSGNNGGKHNSGNNGGKHNSGNSNWNCYYKNYYKNYCYKNYYKNNNHCYKYGAYVPTYYGYGYSPWSIGAYVADPPQTVIVQTAPAPAPAPAPQQRGPCYTAAYYDPRTGAPPLYTVVCP